MQAEARNAVVETLPGRRRLRGIILTNLYPTPQDPTRAAFNRQQFGRLQRLHDLVIVVPHARTYPCSANVSFPDASVEPRVACLNVWHPPIAGRLVNAALLEMRVRDALRAFLTQWRADYILGSFGYPDGVAAVRAARWLGLPAFVKVHGSDINVMAHDPAIRWQLRCALTEATGVIAVSKALAGKVMQLGARPADTLLLYNGIDRQQFRPRHRGAARAGLGLATDRRSILYVGNLKRDKGVLDLLAAFGALVGDGSLVDLADVDLEFVGTGAAARQLRSEVEKRGLTHRVHLHGARGHESVADWLAACVVLCLPSHAEGVPNVVLEAQACGRPVVATNVGGIPEVVSASAGYLVEPASPALLTDALRQALHASWDETALVRGLTAPDWPGNAAQLSRFIEARCPRVPGRASQAEGH
jgi:glycosyltransferase involved in cell wall biosynthesis